MNRVDLPLGFGMALAQNPQAMEKFAKLSEEQKQEIINGTHSVKSKADMRRYVENIVSAY